jgi:thioredoxin 1
VEQLCEKHDGKPKLVEIDVCKNKRLCLNLRVLGLPTFLIYKNGEEVGLLKGGELKIAEIEEAVKKMIK